MASQVFSDNFNRADGPVGAGWTVLGGNPQIAGGQLAGSSLMAVRQTTPFSTSNQAIQFLFITNPNVSATSYFWLRTDAGRTNGYRLTITTSATATQLQLDKLVAAATVNLGYVRLQQGGDTPIDVVLGYYNGEVYLGIGGQEGLRATDSTVPVNYSTYINMPSTGCFVDNWVSWDLMGGLMVVNPTPPGEGETYWNLALSNDLPLWTPGTPGSPIFGVDAGTIITQEVTGPTSAIVVWEPPAVYHQVQIHDGDAGTFGSFIPQLFLDSGGGAGGGGTADLYYGYIQEQGIGLGDWLAILQFLQGLGGLGDDSIALVLDILGRSETAPTVQQRFADVEKTLDDITPYRTWTPGPDKRLRALVEENWTALGNLLSDMSRLTSANTLALEDIRGNWGEGLQSITRVIELLADIQTAGSYDFQDVLDWITAVRGVGLRDLTEIYAAIEALSPGSNPDIATILSRVNYLSADGTRDVQQVLNAISSIRTDALYTLADPVYRLDSLTSNGSQTLQTVLDAIAGITGTDIQPILDQLSAIRTLDNWTLGSVKSWVDAAIAAANAATAAVGTRADAIDSALTAIHNHLHDIITAIGNIQPGGADGPRPSIWPGLAGVVLGDVVNFDTDLEFSGACQGIILHLTHVTGRYQKMSLGNYESYRGLGRYSFVSDVETIEEWQALPSNHAILVPKSMSSASGLVLSCYRGVQGTVQPWTLLP